LQHSSLAAAQDSTARWQQKWLPYWPGAHLGAVLAQQDLLFVVKPALAQQAKVLTLLLAQLSLSLSTTTLTAQ
jgi:hypothetical protein